MKQSNNGIGFLGILFLILLTLKLAEIGVVATWSWWWIFGPLWIPLAVVGVIIGLAVASGWRPK